MSISKATYRRFYPDLRRSGTVFFYQQLRDALKDEKRVLNLGAGPGDGLDSDVFEIRDLRGENRTICGCDPDSAVLENHQLDEARIMPSDDKIPYSDEYFDLVFADYVLEHVERPQSFLSEVFRVLRAGGEFHFRTPNVYHYASLAARVLPHSVHGLIANRARGLSDDAHEPYPTWHRMNTPRSLRRLAAEAGFRRVELVMYEGEPFYLQFNTGAFLAGVTYERLVNRFTALRGLRANMIGTIAK